MGKQSHNGKVEFMSDKRNGAEYFKEYYRKNAQKVKARNAEYHRKNAEKIKEYQAEYHRKNAEKIKAQQVEYYRKTYVKSARNSHDSFIPIGDQP